MNTLMKSISNATGNAGLQVKKHSPEILMGVGVAGFVSTVIFACRATTRAEEVLDRHAKRMEEAKEAAAVAEPNDGYDIKKETIMVYSETAVGLAKLYWPAIGMGTLSIACFLKAYSIINTRYLGVVAAYNAVSGAFDLYRQRVKEELGEQMDRHFRYGSEMSDMEITEFDEKGKSKTVKEKAENIDRENIGASEYAKFFDNHCIEWDPNPIYNLKWLRANETAANDILNSRGHIFLNEVYDMIGLPHTTAGAVVGWVKGQGDGFVDFGLNKPDNESARRFINGEDNVVLLDFNVDGVIYDKI